MLNWSLTAMLSYKTNTQELRTKGWDGNSLRWKYEASLFLSLKIKVKSCTKKKGTFKIDYKGKGSIIRSKCKWIERGEKPTAFFFNLEKRNYNRKSTKKMEGAEGTTLHREILQRNMSIFLITEWFLTISHFGKKPSIYLKSNSHFGN